MRAAARELLHTATMQTMRRRLKHAEALGGGRCFGTTVLGAVSEDLLLSLSMAHLQQKPTNQRSLAAALQGSGLVSNRCVLGVVGFLDRRWFVPDSVAERLGQQLYHDQPAGISIDGSANHHVMTSGVMHAQCLEALNVPAGHRCLDLGSGTGWMTVAMAMLAGGEGGSVGIDIEPSLVDFAATTALARCADACHQERRLNVRFAVGDIRDPATWTSSHHPRAFDRIHIGVALPQLPEHIIELLAPNGRTVVPIGELSSEQSLMLVTKGDDGQTVTHQELQKVVFSHVDAPPAAEPPASKTSPSADELRERRRVLEERVAELWRRGREGRASLSDALKGSNGAELSRVLDELRRVKRLCEGKL
ncbi:unnamed protein product [Vitrella brassicaformis CCMP3155]|uniref:protein-L-isoaspartate(D-aspartate) O-methyltransferase n=2 Tax=Vitrella brassicaformis TaxID=1169539 RepID=A0A0G4FGW8_VITBC|nr:unnamed protein product [Vitrella brassicaformis CCMP3155]|mmetsp:Transcript_41965/g.119059  ORF Transcript_41965/g.119059 Transcript_41965/m.119059 type:complete len:363 (-) Transcript_41965:42-1130(-)|eukprot:CEM12095.1 unnamed protein product [Vitrella brassicaformis CCMP3155]